MRVSDYLWPATDVLSVGSFMINGTVGTSRSVTASGRRRLRQLLIESLKFGCFVRDTLRETVSNAVIYVIQLSLFFPTHR
jgi:hypothetical protein